MKSKVPSAAAWARCRKERSTAKPVAPFREWLRKKIQERMQERFEARREGDEHAPDHSGDANRTLSALDHYGVWKVFDGPINAAFYGKSMDCALGHRHEQRLMGLWSDGVPVKELLVTQFP